MGNGLKRIMWPDSHSVTNTEVHPTVSRIISQPPSDTEVHASKSIEGQPVAEVDYVEPKMRPGPARLRGSRRNPAGPGRILNLSGRVSLVLPGRVLD